MINYGDFSRLEIKIGTIKSAIRVENSEKLVQLQVDIGEDNLRQLVAGIAKAYSVDELIGKQIVVLVNLEPKKLMGLESQGMLLAASDNDMPVLLQPDKNVSNGCSVK